jgi:hypothetical protein
MDIWLVNFSRLGILYQEKSGNPAAYQNGENISNGHKLDQCLPSQDTPKLTNWDFGFENIPSGNGNPDMTTKLSHR